MAAAHAAIGLYLSDVDSEKSLHRETALRLYRGLVASEPTDADALLGVATHTSSPTERLEYLKRAAVLKPSPIVLDSLVGQLRRVGTSNAFVEAADALVRAANSKAGTDKWSLLSEAADLYREAGREDLVVELQAKNALHVAERQIPGSDSENQDAVSSYCKPEVVNVVGARNCLSALSAMVEKWQARGFSRTSLGEVEALSDLLMRLSGESVANLAAAEPDWRRHFLNILVQLRDAGVRSSRMQLAIASFENSKSRKLEALLGAYELEPNNSALAVTVASEYMRQRRWDAAEDIYRRAKSLPDARSIHMQAILDHNIEQAVRMRELDRKR